MLLPVTGSDRQNTGLTGLEASGPLPVVLQTVIENVRVVGPPGFWVVALAETITAARLQRECEEIAA
jgi:hypothetical protein